MELTPQVTAQKLSELLQEFIRLHPQMEPPEHIQRIKQQMDGLRTAGAMPDDYEFLLRVFIILVNSEEPPTMGELSESLHVPLSTATRIVEWLVRAEFVERLSDPSDRRVVRVQMTEKGQQIYQLGIAYNIQRIAKLLDGFSSEEQHQLINLAGKLLKALSAENEHNTDGGSLT